MKIIYPGYNDNIKSYSKHYGFILGVTSDYYHNKTSDPLPPIIRMFNKELSWCDDNLSDFDNLVVTGYKNYESYTIKWVLYFASEEDRVFYKLRFAE